MFPFQRNREIIVESALRFAIGSMFLWFGLDKWLHPSLWTSLVPSWGQWWLSTLGVVPLMAIVGASELALGTLLVVGRLLRPTAALAVIYLTVGALSGGINDAAVRDLALVGASLALLVHENRRLSARRIPEKYLNWLWRGYVVLLLAVGLLYLGAI